MTHRTSQTLTAWFVFWDVTLTATAWLVSYWLRFDSGLFGTAADQRPPLTWYLGSLPVVLMLAYVTYRTGGMYDVHRLRRFREELLAVGRGVGLMALAVMATSYAQRHHYESRLAMGLFVGGTLTAILTARRATWTAVRRLRARGVNQSRALVVGTGRLARRTVRTLRTVSWAGIQPLGYVEDVEYRTAAATDLPVLGGIADLPELVARHDIHYVFIALPLHRYADARRVFHALAQTVVDVQLVADIPAIAGMAFHTTHLDGMTVISLRESPHHGVNVLVKRAMDVVLASAALVVFAPVMLVIALVVKLSSPGPVFYRQERCGLNGRPFRMLKFRTMRVDAEANGPQMTTRNDPRRTWVGGFLRSTNLDELPQLFNVLWGDMSLVGPRPERPVFVRKFAKTIPGYMARHAVKAGMTGWAQVNGWRGNSSLRRRVQYDLYYITHWNPLFDLRILFLTVWGMLFKKQKHAY